MKRLWLPVLNLEKNSLHSQNKCQFDEYFLINHGTNQMLKIKKQGMADGEYDISIVEGVENIQDIKDTNAGFFGDILIKGKLSKIDNRYIFNGFVECHANLICDISGEEYVELIRAEIQTVFIENEKLLNSGSTRFSKNLDEVIIHEKDEYIDLTDEVRDALCLGIPMRHISPKYIGKSFSDCFPEHSADNIQKDDDDRWEKLRSLDLQN